MKGGMLRKSLISKLLISAFCVLVSTNFTFASGGGDKLDIGEMIMHHIKDAHEIHFAGDFAIYLPVIIYGDNGLEVFSSSHFYHNKHVAKYMKGDKEVEAEYYVHGDYALYHEHIYKAPGGNFELDESGKVLSASAFDLSLTKSVAGMFLAILLCVLLFGAAAKGYKKRKGKAPKGLQSFLEPLILFVRDEIARPSIGPRADKFVPFPVNDILFHLDQ